VTGPRTADEVHAEQVAQGQQAVEAAMAANEQQQAAAAAWYAAGLPADMGAQEPSPSQLA
jgi:hypothetical protein